MRVVVQRCLSASVSISNKLYNKIERGFVLFVGFTYQDKEEEIHYMIQKIKKLRIFDDNNGIMNLSIEQVKGEILSISQFTLYADASKGSRPSYIKALPGKDAKPLYDLFNQKLKEEGLTVKTGIFGADMKVNLTNDGPVTILLEKEKKYE